MESISATTRQRQHKSTRLQKNSKIITSIIRAIQEKKGQRIVSLDLRKIPEAIADFFIICEADNSIQIKAIAEHVEEYVKQQVGESPYRQEGYTALKWVLLDYVNVVVHIFYPETRQFYKLEEMWSDAEQTEFPDA
ncbi:MAG: ribosome silencing factor [Thermoflavifilum aggregans]|nr:ribosome silencing factor [Thermoflavifilum aggregans]